MDDGEFPQSEFQPESDSSFGIPDAGTPVGRTTEESVVAVVPPEGSTAPVVELASPVATKKHGRGLLVATLAAVLVVAIGVIVGVAASSGSGSKAAPAGTPNQVVLTAIDSTVGAKTADMSLSMVLTIPGKGKITASGGGSVDFATNAAQMAIGYGGEPALADQRLTERFVGGSAYLSESELSTILPGKSWIAVPVGGSSLAPGSSNPASMLQVLQSEGDIVTPLGPSVVNGAPVEGYHVVVTEAELSKRLSQENLPSGLAQAAQAAKGMFGPGGLAMTIYISDANHLLARMVMDLHLSILGLTVSGAVTEDTTDYGVPVSITAPPADQVASFEQFTQAAANLTGGAASN